VSDRKGEAQAGELVPAAIFCVCMGFFAAWTVGANLVALAALPFRALYLVLASAVCAAALALRSCRSVARLFRPGPLLLPSVSLDAAALATLGAGWRLVAAVIGILFVVAAGVQYKRSQFLPLWALCLLTAGLALWRSGVGCGVLRLTAGTARPGGMPVGVGTALLIAALLTFYYLTSVPDADDSLFLNFAVGALRHRDAVFAHDTMLGLPGLALIKSTYRLESYQLLAAIVSDLSGLPVIVSAHAVVPALSIILAGSILALVHRALFARDWLIGVAVHLLWLIVLDGALQSYGYHALPRFFQGKGPFVMAMIPLLVVLTTVSVRERSWLGVGLLSLAVVVSVGFTANAIFAAPLAIALVAAPLCLLGEGAQRRECWRLVLAIPYPAVLAAYLLLLDPPSASEFANAGTVGLHLWDVLGTPSALVGGLGLLFLASAAALLNVGLRSATLYALVLLAVVVNPLTWDFYGRHVTGNVNYRLLWAVPLPLFVAAVTVVLWRSAQPRWRLAVAVALLAATASPGSVLRRVHWGPSLLKVPEPQYALARSVNDLTPQGGMILAPQEIARWIPTLQDGRPVVEACENYLPQRASQLPARQYALRSLLIEWLWMRRPSDSEAVAQALDALDVRTVVVGGDPGSSLVRQQMTADPTYRRDADVGVYWVFRRSGSERDPQSL
jgi:hypothetical protein